MVCLFFVGFVITSNFGGFGMVLQGLNLGLQFDTGMKKIKVYTFTDEGASPKCIKIMKGDDEESLDDLRVHLGSCILTLHIVNVCYKVWL